MSEAQNVDILSGVRKAVGDFSEGLKSFVPSEMASLMAAGYMDMRHVKAVTVALEHAGFAPADKDLIKANEAFAAQAPAISCEPDLDANKVNPNGSGVATGHPVGATKLRCMGGRHIEAA